MSDSSQYQYGASFLDHTARSGRHSAAKIVQVVLNYLRPESLLDVGCATGAWLDAWSKAGVQDLRGIDGPYVNPQRLQIPSSLYTAMDLNSPFDLGRTFDLVQSLEVAEHLQPSHSEAFVACLASHAERFILFSAAPPGQGGEFHINERPYQFWRAVFQQHGFAMTDPIRPIILDEKGISYWYRYNIFLFVRREILPNLPAQITNAVVPPDAEIIDVSPPFFRLRKAALRVLPYRLQHEVARLKASVFPTRRF